ncbi:MAG: GPW/gp25 family protein [Chloroflexi bacterium]|nr:GPW/gp25 family protein [Chloroflexota bacterium]
MQRLEIAFPFSIDGRGYAEGADYEAHIRQMIEQVLFVAPGQRVNRPNFGTGLLELVFAPISAEVVAATQTVVQGSIQQWLEDLITVEGVIVSAEDSSLQITVRYVIRKTGQRVTDVFTRRGA